MANGRDHKWDVTIIGVVALVFLAVALVLGLSFGDDGDRDLLPIITPIIGLIAPTIVALLTLLKVQDARADLRNGVVEKPVRQAMTEVLSERPPVREEVRAALEEILSEHLADDEADNEPPARLRVERRERRSDG
jgi:hypothetical protein